MVAHPNPESMQAAADDSKVSVPAVDEAADNEETNLEDFTGEFKYSLWTDLCGESTEF